MGDTLFFEQNSVTAPAEIFTLGLNGDGEVSQRTKFNEGLLMKTLMSDPEVCLCTSMLLGILVNGFWFCRSFGLMVLVGIRLWDGCLSRRRIPLIGAILWRF